MPETEGQSGEGEREPGKKEMKLGKTPTSLLERARKRATFSVADEVHKPWEIPIAAQLPYLEDVKLECSVEISMGEVQCKQEPEGPEEKMAIVNRLWEKIQKEGFVEGCFGLVKDAGGIPSFGLPKEWLGEGLTPELKKSAVQLGSFELNLHNTWSFPNARPVPLELQMSLVICSFNDETGEWEKFNIQGEVSMTGIELPDWDLGESTSVKGAKLEAKVTLSAHPEWTKLWEAAKPMVKKAAQQAGTQIKAGARSLGKLVSKGGKEVELFLEENGELIADAAIEILIDVATVVLVIAGLATVIYLLDVGYDLDDLPGSRDKAVDQLTSFFVRGLQGEHLDKVEQYELNQAFNAGKKQRAKLLADHGDQFDSWLADNQAAVIDAAKKQFKLIVSDALWAGFASNHSVARDQWTAWNTLYGAQNDPVILQKLPLFTKYAAGALRPPPGYVTGDWSRYGVGQAFLDMS